MFTFLEPESEDFESSNSSSDVPRRVLLTRPFDQREKKEHLANLPPCTQNYQFFKQSGEKSSYGTSNTRLSSKKVCSIELPHFSKPNQKWESNQKGTKKVVVKGPKPGLSKYPTIKAMDDTDEDSTLLDYSTDGSQSLEKSELDLSPLIDSVKLPGNPFLLLPSEDLGMEAQSLRTKYLTPNGDDGAGDSLLLRPLILFAGSESNVSASQQYPNALLYSRRQCSESIDLPEHL